MTEKGALYVCDAYIPTLERCTNEEVGQIFKKLMIHASGEGTFCEKMSSPKAEVIYDLMKDYHDAQIEKYKKRCEINRRNVLNRYPGDTVKKKPEAAKRKSISKRERFAVFERDSFTCQYCGRKAPEVHLEIDHIRPVCDGGTNDISNLITACAECNTGKGGRYGRAEADDATD